MIALSKALVRTTGILATLCVWANVAAAQTPTARVVSAANAFLSSLDDAQRQRAVFAFDDEKQRAQWSNLPITIVPRSGIKFAEMTPAQRTAAMNLLSTVLSKRGFEKVQQIVNADELLRVNERSNAMFGKDLYFFSFLGTPSEKTPWMLQFGGHHLGLNITVVGTQGVLTPSMVGAQPAMYTVDGKTIRPMGQESDKAHALINNLDNAQRAKAILGYRVADLVLGPGQDGKVIQPEGLKASEMNARQKSMLLDLISEWSAIVHESAGDARMVEIKAAIDETWFAWSGPTEVEAGKNGAAYYRIQGPKLVIEYAPQQMGGNPGMHIHSMYRDPTNDYGRKPAGR